MDVNKYTNTIKAETKTPEYITVIQDLKHLAKNKMTRYKPRYIPVTNSYKSLTHSKHHYHACTKHT
jgi:hypothetical protein